MHNPKRSERRADEEYLVYFVGEDYEERDKQRVRCLSDARNLIERDYAGELLSINDYGLRYCVDSRDTRGFGRAGSIHEGGPRRRCWDVLFAPKTGKRLIRLVKGR